MKKYFSLGYFLLFYLHFLWGQQNPMEFRHLDKNDGLDQPFPYSIIQDQSGFIWIGGENGLWRYSGSEFKHFHHSVTDSNSLAYDFVWKVFEDSKGNIWAGTYGGGLSKYNPEYNQFTNYIHKKGDSTSISNNQVRGIEEDHEGNIWVGTNKGLNKLNPETEKFTRYNIKDGLADNTIRTIQQSKDNKKLFIATAVGLNILNLETNNFHFIGESTIQNEGLRYAYIYDLMETDDHKLWVATGGGLEIVDTETYEVTHIPNESTNGAGLSHSVCFSIYQNPQNPDKIWFGTMNGINFYDQNEKTFHQVKARQKNKDNIGGSSIYNVFEDRNGGVWAAVNNAGVFYSHPAFNKFDYESFLPTDTDKYLNRYTSYIDHDANTILITTYSGLIEWNPVENTHKIYQFDEGDPNSVNRMTQIQKWKENEYLISVWGNFIYHWNHQSKKLTALKNNSEDTDLKFNLRIFVDHKKRIWLGNSLKGLFQYDLENENLIPFPVSDLTDIENSGDEYIKYITEDNKNRLWIGTADGIHFYNEQDNSFKKFEASKKDEYLSNGNINHITASKNGGIWISTEVGLNYLNIEDSSFTRYFKKDGLPSNVISSSLEDGNGDLWIATASGLSKMENNGSFINYDQSDGLREEYFIFGSAFKGNNGTLYFGTSREFIHFQPDELSFNKKPPTVYFDQLEINNEVINVRSSNNKLKKALSYTKNITLNPEDYLINISYDGLNLINGNKNQYSILLDGLDEKWRPASTKKSITLSKLTPGNYTLRLKALNDENIWSKEEATLAIKVLPYWYNSDWFRILLSLSILLIVGLTLRWRFNQIKNINKKLETLVNNRTEEVMAQKEEIESQNEKLFTRNERIELLLRELNHRIKNNLQLISSILNLHSRSTDNLDAKMALTEGKLRMQALSLLHQKLYMTEKYTEVNCKEYIRELIDYLSIAFKSNYSDVNFNLDIDNFKLNLDQAVPLGLILNELVTNSLKHSGKDELIIDLIAKKEKEHIYITLKDNGKGISQKQFENSNSFGISMIKSLVDQINGKLTVGLKKGPHFILEFISKETE
ncbi:two-component regulator propeller domain-containing protein [Marivirga salinae]|uniref:histidine kinase n=1 Tax=Marivirga salinarum TaxID=3059078 RepID=A0AA51N9A4_9BACT|nr:two-component regulator propeller domain-containing protein [Marivirga sp. BDSF4-3]WMN10948.1 two-component regulator propeller domain-containing protein [Marivirga sp. BDSF4-3]